MKLAICAKAEGLEAPVDERFGRCPYFVIVDPDDQESAVSVRNAHAEASGGAGPQAAQLLSAQEVDAVALGNIGPNAVAALAAARIKVYTGVAGTVEETLQNFREDKLTPVTDATVPSHAGMRGRK